MELTITVIGTILTAIGTFLTFQQAKKAKGYKDQIKFDVRKINLLSFLDQIKRSQDHIRKLPSSKKELNRGIVPKEIINLIRQHFDSSLGLIPTNNQDTDIRKLITSAQEKLNLYEISVDDETFNAATINELRTLVQDAVANANDRIYNIEGKS